MEPNYNYSMFHHKKRRVEMVKEEGLADRHSPGASSVQDSPIDFSVKNDTNGHLSPKESRDLSMISPLEERNYEINFTSPIKSRFQPPQALANPNCGISSSHFPAMNLLAATNSSLKMRTVSPMNRLMSSKPLPEDNIYLPERASFMNNGSTLPPHHFNEDFTPLFLPKYPEMNSRCTANTHSLGVHIPTPYNCVNGESPEQKSTKSVRPFKQFESEILNYDPKRYYNSIPDFKSTRTDTLFSPATSSVTNISLNGRIATTTSSDSSLEHEQGPSPNSKSATFEECLSQNGFSDDAQQSSNTSPRQLPDSCQTSRRRGEKIPDDKKDAVYLEKRRKNNQAAKRSRDARRRKEDEMALKAKSFMEENKRLLFKLEAAETRINYLMYENGKLRTANFATSLLNQKLQTKVDELTANKGLRNGNSTDFRDNPGL